MKDDPDFNILFLTVIEKHGCLYDYTNSSNSNRNEQDRAWEKIAKEASESVQDCKERWRNIRACYSRHLKSSKLPSGSATKARKAYYLAEYLNFLEPFTKSRKQSGNIKSLQPQPPESQVEETEGDEGDSSTATLSIADEISEASGEVTSRSEHEAVVGQDPASSEPRKKLRKLQTTIDDVNKSALEFFNSRKNVKSLEQQTESPDLLFFKSLLPDIAEMNGEQKRRFRVGVLNLIGNILNTTQSTTVPQCTSVSHQDPVYTNLSDT